MTRLLDLAQEDPLSSEEWAHLEGEHAPVGRIIYNR